MKKEFPRRSNHVLIYEDFRGISIVEMKKKIDALYAEYGNDVVFDYNQEPYSEERTFEAFRVVPETDKEYEARKANHERWEKVREENERATFERLSKKYGS